MPRKVNEELWDKAKAKVTEEYGPESRIGNEKFYKLTSTIYKNMGGEFHKEAFEIVSDVFKAGLFKGADELTTKGREQIKEKNFALPEERKYPIEDIEHARNALARVSQHGTPEEKAQVTKKVEEKYPSLKEGDDEHDVTSVSA